MLGRKVPGDQTASILGSACAKTMHARREKVASQSSQRAMPASAARALSQPHASPRRARRDSSDGACWSGSTKRSLRATRCDGKHSKSARAFLA